MERMIWGKRWKPRDRHSYKGTNRHRQKQSNNNNINRQFLQCLPIKHSSKVLYYSKLTYSSEKLYEEGILTNIPVFQMRKKRPERLTGLPRIPQLGRAGIRTQVNWLQSSKA